MLKSHIRAEWDLYPNTGRFLLGRRRSSLTVEERCSLEQMMGDSRALVDGETLVRRGELIDRSCMLVEGFMLQSAEHDGGRSIISIHVPGDFIDLNAYALKRLDYDLVSLGPSKVALVSHERLARELAQQPHLTRLLWFSTLLDAAIHREWICKLEQLQAAQRVAHIFAELWYRLDLVGLGSAGSVRTPLTQALLASMCGVTSIHMNRALGHLRREGIADFRRGTLYVENRSRLEAYGAFNPAYLYSDESSNLSEATLHDVLTV